MMFIVPGHKILVPGLEKSYKTMKPKEEHHAAGMVPPEEYFTRKRTEGHRAPRIPNSERQAAEQMMSPEQAKMSEAREKVFWYVADKTAEDAKKKPMAKVIPVDFKARKRMDKSMAIMVDFMKSAGIEAE